MLLPQIPILFCNNLFVLRCMRLLLDCCNKWCVMLNHYDLGLLCFGLKSLMISWTTRVIWAQVWEFDCFSDCFWTCTLIIWTVPWHLVLEQDSTVKHVVKNMNFNLKSVSGHILYARIRTFRWLIKVLAWGFMHHISISLPMQRVIVWGPSAWVVMYGSFAIMPR
jgi:hypothetical protein